MFAYPCPSCRQRLLAPTGRVGQRSICPKCLQPLTVPHPEQVVAGGPFAPTPVAPEPSPEEPYQPTDEHDEPVEAEHDTPAPMNTMPARTGEFVELERPEPATEHFLDLPSVLLTPPPAVFEEVALTPVAALRPAAPVASVTPATPSSRLSRPQQKEQEGRVAFDTSSLFAGDAMAQLSAAISMRMAPPPPPMSDSIYAVTGWVTGTLVGLAGWVLGVWQVAGLLPFVAVVGGAMVAFGLLWRAYLSGSWAKGLITLLPPMCLIQLVRPVAGVGLRPLWFVLSGIGLLGLFVVGSPVKRWVDGTFEVQRVDAPLVEVAPLDLNATAQRLENKADREEAKKTLVKAGATAEPAVRKMLTAKADGTALAACDVLAEIGTADSVTALRKLADDTTSKAVRIEAASAADAIEKRLGEVK